jgi:hypothetical protein
VRYTADEAAEMLRRGEDLTDYARFDAVTEEELEASIDLDEEGVPDWSTVYVGLPPLPGFRPVLIDADLFAWFETQGRGVRDRINAVLRAHVEAQERRPLGAVER